MAMVKLIYTINPNRSLRWLTSDRFFFFPQKLQSDWFTESSSLSIDNLYRSTSSITKSLLWYHLWRNLTRSTTPKLERTRRRQTQSVYSGSTIGMVYIHCRKGSRNDLITKTEKHNEEEYKIWRKLFKLSASQPRKEFSLPHSTLCSTQHSSSNKMLQLTIIKAFCYSKRKMGPTNLRGCTDLHNRKWLNGVLQLSNSFWCSFSDVANISDMAKLHNSPSWHVLILETNHHLQLLPFPSNIFINELANTYFQ